VSLSVATVTVAHNERNVLGRQMEALLRQSRPPDEIVIVDNSSTDGTLAFLADRYPQVTVLRMSENLGAAGALAKGLAYAALEKRYDWILTLDADSTPGDEVIETLLRGARSLAHCNGNLGMVAALPFHRETGACYPPLLWRERFVKPSAEQLQQPAWFADLVYSSGCMVRREVIEKIGLPRADFFMDFFDFEFCLRARSHDYKIAVITGAPLAHEVGKARRVRLAGWSHLWQSYAPWREYYFSRNITYAVWWLYPSRRSKRFVARHLARHAAGVALFSSQKLACLRRMVQGFWDGRRARLGVRFLP